MRLLDLFCGAGGAGMGYHLAGFEVTGVDISPQPHYPFEFVQADALEYLETHGHAFDVIHASPPCQAYSQMRHLPWLKGRSWPKLIGPVRELLQHLGRPYVIENVKGAPLAGGELCGVSVGLELVRHRVFECEPLMLFPGCAGHGILYSGRATMGVRGKGVGVMGVPGHMTAKDALGIDWMTGREMRQAIPPAYTRWIGERLLEMI